MQTKESDTYELVVGLETHVQLSTQTKIFSGDPNSFGQAPNTNISWLTLALPGTLPKLNKTVVESAIKMGLACGCKISRYNVFDRKNYFYPDLPKGFQTTQDKTPICLGGLVRFRLKDGQWASVPLNRIHMEEDAGKSIHLSDGNETQVDLNRAGVPLLEIVTEPAIPDAETAMGFLAEIRKLVRYLGVSDGNMEEGSLRCDANVSVRKKGAKELGKKVEVKNMNSFRNVQRAIEYEFKRQTALLEKGEKVLPETRLFDVERGVTVAMRSKEELNDYRYFPEPDLPPFTVSDEWLAAIQANMPALPADLFAKFTQTYGLPEYDAGVLTDSKEMATYFEAVCAHIPHYKTVSNWLMTQVKGWLNDRNAEIGQFPLPPAKLAEVIGLVENGQVSHSAAASKLLPALLENPEQEALALAKSLDLLQESNDDFIAPLLAQVLAKYPDKVTEYRKGKKGVIGLFMGDLMKLSQGKIDPQKANALLREALESK